jgi:hypothetical protein
MPVPGATGQSLTVTSNDVLSTFYVEATLDDCTEVSPTVVIDEYAFLPPFVIQEGEFTFDPETETYIICEGDTMFLTLGLPYDTMISWFRNSAPIAGETGPTLAVTATGGYTVEAAPAVCPDFIQPLGIVLNVLVEDCPSAAKPEPAPGFLNIHPNPASDWLRIRNEGNAPIEKVELLDVTGRTVTSLQPADGFDAQLSLDELAGGIYLLKITVNDRLYLHKISKE